MSKIDQFQEYGEWPQDVQEEERELLMMRPPGFWSDFLRISVVVLLLLAIVFFVLNYVGQRVSVEGSSMNPMLQDGDQLLVDKISYRLGDPERFDIVVFSLRNDPETYYIKRIIGMPGETVQIRDGAVWINGEMLEESYGLEAIADAKRAQEPVTLGVDEYFVLGDNRNDSRDSRNEDVGNVSREQLMGKALVRIWPFGEIGLLKD